MTQPKLTQSVLLEVLVAEIESFKKAKEAYSKILTKTAEHLERLEKLHQDPLNVDIAAMQQEHDSIKKTLQKGLYLPRWILIVMLTLFTSLSISLSFNYKHYNLNKDAKAYIDSLERKIKTSPK